MNSIAFSFFSRCKLQSADSTDFSFSDGDVFFVAKRLDARYDWLPSPYTLKAKHPKTKLVQYGDGCSFKEEIPAASNIIIVSRKGDCSYFEKVTYYERVI